jgi:hypothetical protein
MILTGKRVAQADRLIRLLLKLVARGRGKPGGVLLTTIRGPAEMVFLSAVLTRFMRLARRGEKVTLLLRRDAAGMAFLLPRNLILKRIEWRWLQDSRYRWKMFGELYRANYRLVVSLDDRRAADQDEALVAVLDPPESAAMVEDATAAARRGTPYRRLFETGGPACDKILRWSRFADFLAGASAERAALARLPDARLPPAEPLPPTAVLMPFSGVPQRQLRAETWAKIIQALPEHWQIRIAGHQNDFDANPRFMLALRAPVLIETSEFEKLSAVLRGSRLAIGVDTASIHLSILLGVNTLCLASAAFVGAGVPYDAGVIPANARFLHLPVACQGCLGTCRYPLDRGMYPCVGGLTDDMVVGAVQDMLAIMGT